MNSAREYIEKARFFVEKARIAETRDEVDFQNFLETAIVWARSVTFVLQTQYKRVPGFEDWYAKWQDQLGKDPLARFFLEQRNFVLKRKGVVLRKVTTVTVTLPILVETLVTAKVISSSWRSRLRYFPQDVLAGLRRRVTAFRRWLRSWQYKRQHTRVVIAERMFFVEEPWANEPALGLLEKHLQHLEILVKNVSKQFGDPNEDCLPNNQVSLNDWRKPG